MKKILASQLILKNIHTRDLITEKNSCGSNNIPLSPPPQPPITFLMVRPLRLGKLLVLVLVCFILFFFFFFVSLKWLLYMNRVDHCFILKICFFVQNLVPLEHALRIIVALSALGDGETNLIIIRGYYSA